MYEFKWNKSCQRGGGGTGRGENFFFYHFHSCKNLAEIYDTHKDKKRGRKRKEILFLLLCLLLPVVSDPRKGGRFSPLPKKKELNHTVRSIISKIKISICLDWPKSFLLNLQSRWVLWQVVRILANTSRVCKMLLRTNTSNSSSW